MVKKGKAKKREMMKLGQTAAVDDRFLDLTTHPMFKEISLRKKKVIIDKRFKEIFDEHFSEEPSKVCFAKKTNRKEMKTSIINNWCFVWLLDCLYF